MRLAAVAFALGLVCACGERSTHKIERADDAGAGVVIVKRTTDGVRLADEVEPNDEPKAAMALPLPGGVTGTLDGATDVDRYRVDVTEPGWVSAAVPGIEQADLIVELAGADGEVLARCDNGPATVSEGIPNYPVEAGAYTVIVREFTRKRSEPRKGASPPYTLKVALASDPGDAFEHEPNASDELARPLALGGEVRGYVGWRGDEDTWSVPTEGLGEDVALDLDVDAVEGVELIARLARGKHTLVQRRGARGQGLAVRGLAPGAGDEPLLLEISGKRSSFEVPYAVRVAARPLPFDHEVEPNDAPEAATPLAVEPGSPAGARKGYLTPGDADVYAVPAAPARQTLSVTVEPSSLTLDVAVALVTASGDALAEADAGGKGAAESIDKAGIIPNARMYLRVSRKPSDAEDDVAAAYTVRWSVVGDDVIPRALVE